MQLHFKKLGNGPALIIIHGVYGNGENWLYVARYIQNRYTVYLPDMRNHGKSGHTSEFGYDNMAQDIYELIQQEKIDTVSIIGHSMGGRTAMRFAEAHSDIIKQLVVVDISPITNLTQKRARPLFQTHVDIVNNLMEMPIESLKTREEADTFLKKTLPFRDIRQFLLKNLKRDKNQKFFWQINLLSIANALEEIIMGDKTMTAQVDCHTLFIKGEKSDYLTNGDIDLLKTLFSNMEFETIKGAGHWVHADNPEEFKRILTSFLTN